MSVNLPLRGDVRWALVPYALEAPFVGPGWSGEIDFAGVEVHARAGGGGSIRLEILAKMRPVLIMQSVASGSLGTVAVVRLKRLDALPERYRDEVLAGDVPRLVPLSVEIGGVRQIAMVDTVERAHLSAIDRRCIGTATREEMRTIGERAARVLELDLDRLVEERAVTLLEALGVGADQP